MSEQDHSPCTVYLSVRKLNETCREPCHVEMQKNLTCGHAVLPQEEKPIPGLHAQQFSDHKQRTKISSVHRRIIMTSVQACLSIRPLLQLPIASIQSVHWRLQMKAQLSSHEGSLNPFRNIAGYLVSCCSSNPQGQLFGSRCSERSYNLDVAGTSSSGQLQTESPHTQNHRAPKRRCEFAVFGARFFRYVDRIHLDAIVGPSNAIAKRWEGSTLPFFYL
ncbi:hypothetical protein B0H63DRAFT_55823 [Podospora didyma]|uniref:Uncharacterized protein n=1 Tax=Podospora didyma TaxID=330526 RepID=A0AAE0U8B8_9PEZI|nr:hypothetical protein B0H63DRAFT_55823 [Podospora didyma]